MGSKRGASLPRRSWYYGIAGAALLVALGAIHLDLYLTGYRSIPTIGWLFLLQIITSFVLAVAILVTRHWLAAAAGAGFAISTLGGYLLSLKPGLFGFTEVRTTAGIVAAIIDVAAFAVLATAVIIALNLGRQALLATAAASVVALALTGAFVATPKTQPVASGAQTLDARQIGGVNLLTNSKGFTLYWFAPDSPNKSVCNGSCAAYWPPVAGQRGGRPRGHRDDHHDQAHRRHHPGHLRRASAVHLHWRQRAWPGLREQPQPERRAVARRAGLGRVTDPA